MNTITKAEELGYFQEDYKAKPKINTTFTPNQILRIINELSLYCGDDELLKEVDELKEFLKNRL